MKKSCFLAPVHPPKFHQAEQMVSTYNEHFDDDIFLVFSHEGDKVDFDKRYPNLKYKSIIFTLSGLEPSGIVTQKKFFGLKHIFDNTDFEYIGLIDVDVLFFRNKDYDELFRQYFKNGKIYTTDVDVSQTIKDINTRCIKYFKQDDYDKLKEITNDFQNYLWFNEIPVFEKKSFLDFYDYVDMDNTIYKYTNYEYDFIMYAYYLFLTGVMRLEIIGKIHTDRGSLIEQQKTVDRNTFKELYNHMNPMWISERIGEEDMKNTFMMVHVDR